MKRRGDGYASSAGGSEASIGAIALATAGVGPFLGSLNLIFLLLIDDARKYLSSMKEAVKEIDRRWSAANKSGG